MMDIQFNIDPITGIVPSGRIGYYWDIHSNEKRRGYYFPKFENDVCTPSIDELAYAHYQRYLENVIIKQGVGATYFSPRRPLDYELIKNTNTCNILEQHRDKLKDDPERLSAKKSILVQRLLLNRNFWFILIALICIALIAMPVSAYDRIPQGGMVFLNSTVDISGVAAGYNQLVYMYPSSTDYAAYNESITYVIELPQQKEKYYQFYIDPAIFTERLGYWYRYSGYWDSHVNNRAFRVVYERPPVNYTYNETELRELALPPPPPVVPERHVSDYLIARGDPFNVTCNWSKASIWIFGRVTGIYDRKVINGTARFNASETAGLELGSYSLLYYSPGLDRQFDMRISEYSLEYFDSVAFKVRAIDIKPLSPMVVLDRIRWIAGVNDDNFTVYGLEVQDPKIEIVSVDTVMINESLQSAVLQVRGYTNLANNTPISFVFDKDKTPEKLLGQSRAQNRWNSTVLAVESPGSMRYFDYSIPLWLGQIPPGQHEVTVYGSHGTKMSVPFWRYNLPEDAPRRNQTLHYIGGYEFVPTPTPEIVTVEVTRDVIKVQTVIQIETVDYDRLAQEQVNQSIPMMMSYIGWGLLLGIPLLYILWVALRAVYRLMNKRKKEEK